MADSRALTLSDQRVMISPTPTGEQALKGLDHSVYCRAQGDQIGRWVARPKREDLVSLQLDLASYRTEHYLKVEAWHRPTSGCVMTKGFKAPPRGNRIDKADAAIVKALLARGDRRCDIAMVCGQCRSHRRDLDGRKIRRNETGPPSQSFTSENVSVASAIRRPHGEAWLQLRS